jgi:uncharacterized protein
MTYRGLVTILLAFVVTSPALSQQPSLQGDTVAEAPSRLRETQVQLGLVPWRVGATITLPRGEGPFPAVVLVHGSGPGLRDLPVGGSRIFRDLAWGLASRGVAVIRYDKRTTVHGGLLGKRTASLGEEYLEDATRAALALQTTPGVDGARVYILGHSQGASVAPLVANAVGAAGVILVSGSPRPPAEVLSQQAEYIRSISASDPRAQADAVQVAKASALLHTDKAADEDVVLGRPVWYWRSMTALRPVAQVQELLRRGGRALVVQGGRDYLVTSEDMKAWRLGLGEDRSVDYLTLADANHLLQSGVGQMTPAEYAWTRPVSETALDQFARWITQGLPDGP